MAVELGVGYISVGARTDKMADEIRKAATKAGSDATKQFQKSGQKAGQGFGKSFGAEMSASIPGVASLRNTLRGYETAAGKAGALAGKALGVAFTAAATAGIAAAGYTLFKGFERYKALDAATHRLNNLNKTFVQLGKTGIDVQKTMADVNEVVTGTPYSLSAAFTEATNALASGVTDIKKYMTNVADAAAFAGDDIANIGQAFTQVINQGKVDAGILQNQLRNLPIRAWLNEVYGGTEDMTKAISEGRVGIEQLQYVIEKFASGTAKTAGDTIAGSIENMKTAFASLGAEILSALFGGPMEQGTNDLKTAIDAVTGKLKDMRAWVAAHRGEIKDFFDSAVDTAQKLVAAIEKVVSALGGLENTAKLAGAAFVTWKTLGIVTTVTQLSTAVGATNTALAATPGIAGAATAALGPLAAAAAAVGASLWWWNHISDDPGFVETPPVLPNMPTNPDGTPRPGLIPSTPGTAPAPSVNGVPSVGGIPIPGLRPTQPAQPGQRPGAGNTVGGRLGAEPPTPGPSFDWGERPPLGPPPPLQPGTGGSGSGGGGSDSAPRPTVAFDPNLPQWAQGGPVTPEIFSAESSWLDARHDLEEKRAYLNQLEASGTAEAAEIQAAKNAVIEADRDMYEQDMRLQEAKRSAYEDFATQGQSAADQFSSVAETLGSAVQLDEDLGISRGLVGMADNLLRFVAGLAVAPIKGLLSGLTSEMQKMLPPGFAGSTQGAGSGGGMFGNMLSGAFGATSSYGGGGFSDAALLANVPAGRYTQGERGDLTQGLADCSSAVEDLVNLMDGRPTSGASMTTANAAEWLTSRGFRPGTMPGAFNVGFWNGAGNGGHMQATLPGGTNFNWGDNASAARGGVGGTGAFDPAFTHHYYRPVQPQQQQQPWQYPQWRPPGFSKGGGIPGSGRGDTVPVMAEPGEHMLTRDDVSALGGQSGVLDFRNALHRQGGGPIWPVPLTPSSSEELNSDPALTDPGLNNPPVDGAAPPAAAGTGPVVAAPAFQSPSQIKPAGDSPGGTPLDVMPSAPPPTATPLGQMQPNIIGPDGMPVTGPDGHLLGPDGKPIDPADEALKRLAGFIPQAAKANTVAGTSNLSRIWMMGAEVVNGLIDQGVSAASTAVSLAIAGGTMGAGAAGGAQAGSAAASFAIGLGAEAAKRSVSYWYQMGGIATDAIVEQLMPFGAPSWMGFDSAGSGINGLIDARKKAKGGVYDQGGVLEPGGVAVNMSSQPESVLTRQQWDLMAQTQPAAASHGLNIEKVEVKDVDEMSRALSAKQRLAAMQYTGRPGL